MNRVALAVNLGLLVAWPLAWTAPLAQTGLVTWFGGREISVLSVVGDLWSADPGLAVLVAVLALVLPYAKTLALLAVQARRLRASALPVLGLMAKFAMADVFLLALAIVAAKGVGVGYIAPDWGLWLFAGCVGAGIFGSAAARAPR